MKQRLAFKIMTSYFTLDGKRKKPSYWSKQNDHKKQDKRLWIAKCRIDRYDSKDGK